MMDRKVTVVGAGFVGTNCARRIVEKDLADVVLIDVVEGMPQGKALDIMQSAPVEGFQANILGSNDYKDTADSDVVVITAGLARKPGMSRDDLQEKNADIVKSIVKEVAARSPQSILIVVTNPLDVMTHLAYSVSGFASQKVVGMAGILDSARYRYFIAQALQVHPASVQALVLGGHGDAMVPVPSYSTVNGVPITHLLSQERIAELNERTKHGGAEIVRLLKTGSAYYAPSSSAYEMVRSILLDERRLLPCAAYLQGQYGIQDVYCGVPIRLGREGVLQIVELDLQDTSLQALKNSADAVKSNVSKLKF